MRRCLLVIGLVILAVCLTLALAGLMRDIAFEPRHNGKKLREWLADIERTHITGDTLLSVDTNSAAVIALQQMSNEAIPLIVRELRARNSWRARMHKLVRSDCKQCAY